MILLYRSNFIFNTWYCRWNLRIRAVPSGWIPFCSDIIIIIWFICNIMCVFHNNITAWLCAMGRGGGVEKILTFRIHSLSKRNVLYMYRGKTARIDNGGSTFKTFTVYDDDPSSNAYLTFFRFLSRFSAKYTLYHVCVL